MKYLLIIFCILLSSCASLTKPSVEVPKKDPIVVLNCPNLPTIDSEKPLNLGDLIILIVDISNQYYLCKSSAIVK